MNNLIVIITLLMSLNVGFSPGLKKEVVSTSGRQLLVNDAPYFIKGICYNPVPKGATKTDFSSIDQDLALMVEAGINTIRVYAPIDNRIVLDKIEAVGLKIIIGFGFNQNGFFDILSGSYKDYIEKYKSHKAILLWELGNEYNYHPEWFGGDIANWYSALNEAAQQIQALDANHPVATAHGELPNKLALTSCPNIDVWGMNVYRWDKPGTIFKQWEAISEKPMYLSEAGGDSFMKIAAQGYEKGPNQKAQAQANAKILDAILAASEITSGVTLFAFSDEWWKAGMPAQQDAGGWAPNSSGVPYDGTPNEEYWGIVDVDRNKKATFEVVKERFVTFSPK